MKQEQTVLSDHELIIPQRYVSWISAVVIVSIALSFVTGYFWGQRSAYREVVNKAVNNTFADQAHFSLYTAYGTPQENDTLKTESLTSQESILPMALVSDTLDAPVESKEVTPVVIASPQLSTNSVHSSHNAQPTPVQTTNSLWAAELVGFNNHKEAQACLERLLKKGYPVILKERTSKTPKGTKVSWYQIVTEPMSRATLEPLVEEIKKLERIHKVNIVQTGKKG